MIVEADDAEAETALALAAFLDAGTCKLLVIRHPAKITSPPARLPDMQAR